MRIMVMGAGAIGCVMGGLLAKAGHNVHLVGRRAVMDAIRERGLRISGIFGDRHVTNLHTACDAAECVDLNPDVLLVTVKSFDTAAAIDAAAPCVQPGTLAVSCQNGLGNIEILAERIGWERSAGARVIFGARMNAPAEVEVTVIAQPTALGVYEAGPDPQRVRDLAAAMDAAGLPSVYTDNIARELWAKVAYNCALNPLSALLDATYGELRDTPASWAIMEDIVRELYAVANAMPIDLEPATVDGYLVHLRDTLIPPTAAHYASMHADLTHGKRSEIDALNGAIVRFGAQHGVPCPVNEALTRMIKAHETLHSSH